MDVLLDLPEYGSCNSLSVYLSMKGKEVQTEQVVLDALASGKKVFVPYTHSKKSNSRDAPVSVMDMLSLKSEEDYRSLPNDKWGIPTPSKESLDTRANCFGGQGIAHAGSATAAGVGLDLVIVPGMAFDRQLRRLGHGKGYYDTFLESYSRWCQDRGSKMPVLGMFCPGCDIVQCDLRH